MQYPSRTILASLIALTLANVAQAADQGAAEKLTFFTATKVGTAQEVLRQNASKYGLPASLDNLVLSRVQESLLGKHYFYQQMLRGLPVDRAEIVVSIAHNGELLKIFNQTKPITEKIDANAVNQLYVQKNISAELALDKAWANMRVQHALVAAPKNNLVWVVTDDGVQLTHKVDIAAQMPTGGFVQYIHAQNGSVVESRSTSIPRIGKNGDRTLEARALTTGSTLNRQGAMFDLNAKGLAATTSSTDTRSLLATVASGINGSGLVFDPDPRTVLKNDALTDSSPASAFDAAYSTKVLRDLTVTSGVYKLTGPYVNIKEIESPVTAPSTTTNGVWTAKRGNNAFDDTNVYFHLDQNQRYIQSLGFTGTKSILNRAIDVDTNGVSGDDNSHYSGGGSGYLAFGHGCVNDSEDVDVILHEYGHAIHYAINSSWSGADTGGMGEGFGDYWAASYSYSTANGLTYHPEWAFSWDGHGACWAGRMLNRTDAKYNAAKVYGAHQGVTEGGVSFQSDELWSAPLTQSLIALMAAGKPRENVDKIILEAHFGLGANVTMPVMANAIVNTAHNLFPADATYENTFKAKFQAQNILSGVVIPPGPVINETESNNTTATANAIVTSNTTANGSMSASTDVDYFSVS
ncbi:MAG: hypothetical protein K2P84_03675, partial [Undibacterium sp.]|nr:hypothetical protein [Undibacterium sp.]